MKLKTRSILLAFPMLALLSVAHAQTLDQVTSNGSVTTNSTGIQFRNSNITPASGVYNSLLVGHYGGSTQYLRILPFSSYDGSYNWGTQFSYDITNDKWFFQGDVEFFGGLFVDDSQNFIGIGTTSPASKLHVDGQGYFSRSSSNALVLNRTTTTGRILEMQYGGTSTGVLLVNESDFKLRGRYRQRTKV